MFREVKQWDDVEDYLDGVKIENKKDFKKLNSMILKLAEHGPSIINGRTFKKMKTGKRSKHPIIQIEIIQKKYRIHTVIDDDNLYLLHCFSKQKNNTEKNDMEVSISRAKTL